MLDLDGLLCDYDSYWGSDKTFDKIRFKSEVMDNKMFEKLRPLSTGVDLFWGMHDYLIDNRIEYNFQILSSLGAPNDIELAEEAARQKAVWVGRYFGNFIGKLNFTKHKGTKKYFATPNSILLDDTNENVYDFNECHGYGILFNNDMDFDTVFKEVRDTIDKVQQKINIGIY